MQAMILAAGLGTRLKPWTLSHPKALVPVKGVPMLERIICNLREQGFTRVVVNVHHFASQVIDFLASKDFGVRIYVSDETNSLLDTGGAILHAANYFDFNIGPVLIHNVDILSNANLRDLMQKHINSKADSTLLVSDRNSSRKLIFDDLMRLRGWHNIIEDVYRPDGFVNNIGFREYAFSGIHVVGEKSIKEMSRIEPERKFSIIDFLLSKENRSEIIGMIQPGLDLIDIGKPDTLREADT